MTHHDTDLNALLRGAIGFDRITEALDRTLGDAAQTTGFPPYNIEKVEDDRFRVTLAVAGFAESELDIQVRDGELVIEGKRPPETEQKTYLHRGIAGRAFRRTFRLAEHVKVDGAQLEKGLLHVGLHREVPEARRPRRVEIRTGTAEPAA